MCGPTPLTAGIPHYLFGGVRLQTAGDKISLAARVHLSVLIGLVVLAKAVAYWLDRYGLAFSLRGVVQGASVVRRLMEGGPDAVGAYVAQVRAAIDERP